MLHKYVNLFQMDHRYICIECGHKATELYKDFQGGIIKISHCEKCSGVVDKYIEFDPVIICLDALLHKPQTYRHLLFNIDTSSTWKLAMIFLLCDTYIKWVNQKKTSVLNASTRETQLFYAAFESEIYAVFVIMLLEWLLMCGTVILILNVLHRFFISSTASVLPKPFSRENVVFLHRALVVSSFGKLLAIPAIIWGQTFGDLYLPLTRFLTFTSNLTALKVVCDKNQVFLFLILLFAHVAQHATGGAMMSFLYT